MKQNKKLKVLLTTNIPAPYMIEYLDCLGKKCSLTVLFENDMAKDRAKEWYGDFVNKSFKAVFLNAIPITAESGLSFKIIKYLKMDFNRIIIANPTTPTGIIALIFCRIRKIHFMIQSEGGFRGSGNGVKEKIKRFIMEKADLYLSGMQGEMDYFLSYGATKDTLKWYPFTSLKYEQIDQTIISNEEKEMIKRELNIFEKQVIISVGRPIYSKGFDILLQSKCELPKEVGIYIVGANATDEYLSVIKDNDLENIHFIEHCDYVSLRKYYHAADVFVLPTRGDTWGLVINEAMACGLPVITTERCIAGLQLIENDKNGYIIPINNAKELSNKIKILLNDSKKCEFISRNNLVKIKPYYIENMAEYIFKSINEYE